MLKLQVLHRITLFAGLLLASVFALSQPQQGGKAPIPSTPTQGNANLAAAQTPVPQKPADSLKVESTDANHLRVQISEPSTLNKVFKAICTEQKLDCTGADTLTSYSVPKMTVDGTLRDVVENLLGGTGVNYRYTHATESAKAKLVLLGHAPQGTNTPPPASAKEEEPAPRPLHSIPFPGGRGTPGATVPPPDAAPNGSEQPQAPNGPATSK